MLNIQKCSTQPDILHTTTTIQRNTPNKCKNTKSQIWPKHQLRPSGQTQVLVKFGVAEFGRGMGPNSASECWPSAVLAVQWTRNIKT